MGVSINGGTPKWMNYNGKSYENGWFRGTPILGNLQATPATCGVFYHFNTSMMFSEAVTTVKCCLGIAVGIRLGTWKLQRKKCTPNHPKTAAVTTVMVQQNGSYGGCLWNQKNIKRIVETCWNPINNRSYHLSTGAGFFSIHIMLTNRFELLHA